ncbi:unnamed protein product, partial [Didymodactylos carnosus]
MPGDNTFSRYSRFPYSFFDSFRTSMNDDILFDFSDEHDSDDDDGSENDRHNSTMNSDEFDFNIKTDRRKMPHHQPRYTNRTRPKWNNNW